MLKSTGTRAASDKLRYLLGVSASALAISAISPAYAQDVVNIPDEEEDDAEETRDTVVVTGSRIRQDEFSSSAPIQVIDPRVGELQGQFDTASLVQSSSIAAGSAQITAAISSNFVTNGGTGASTVSLRGLGADRTLVLLNGRRAGPAGTRGAVNAFDLNVIPQSVIGNITILKDGASSVYGSDAVAGVVNLITKKDLDGLELDAFISQPFESGGEQYRASATYGKEFDRGHFQVAFDYFKNEEVRKRDRDFLDCPEDYIFNPDGSRADLIDPRTSGINYSGPNGYACANGTTWGHIWLYDYSYYYSGSGSNITGSGLFVDEFGNQQFPPSWLFQYDYDGQLAASGIPALPAAVDGLQITVPPGFFPVAYDRLSNSVTNNYAEVERYDTVIPKTERFTIFADAAYNLSDGIEAYVEFIGNRRTTTVKQASSQFWNFTFTNDFGAFGLADPTISPNITGAALISPTTMNNRNGFAEVEVDYYRVLGGFRGELNTGGFLDGWNWDIYGQHSNSNGDYTNDRLLDDAVGTTEDGSGLCAPGELSPISMRPCIDIDFNDPAFLAGFHTQPQIDYLFDQETGNTKYTQTYVEAFLTGDLFEMPAGPVGVAFGGTWRRDKIDDLPGPITFLRGPDGIGLEPPQGNAWGSSSAGNTVG